MCFSSYWTADVSSSSWLKLMACDGDIRKVSLRIWFDFTLKRTTGDGGYFYNKFILRGSKVHGVPE